MYSLMQELNTLKNEKAKKKKLKQNEKYQKLSKKKEEEESRKRKRDQKMKSAHFQREAFFNPASKRAREG